MQQYIVIIKLKMPIAPLLRYHVVELPRAPRHAPGTTHHPSRRIAAPRSKLKAPGYRLTPYGLSSPPSSRCAPPHIHLGAPSSGLTAISSLAHSLPPATISTF